jgi:peptidoglycan/LPS O-acetylase OafA/YrhL
MLEMPAVQSESTMTSRQHRNRALDGARGASALLVVLHHCASPAAGGTGPGPLLSRVFDVAGHGAVALLFMLSGYLLFREFAGKLLFGESRTPLPHYFERRFLRIYPAYWVSLVGCAVVLGAANINGSVFGLFTLTERFINQVDLYPGLAVYWTLAVEVSFYVFLPLFATAVSLFLSRINRVERRIKTLLVLILGLTAITPLYIGLVVSAHHGDFRIISLLPRYIGWFSLGMLLTVLAELRNRQFLLPRALTDLADRTWAWWLCSTAAFIAMIALKWNIKQFVFFSDESTFQSQLTMLFLGVGAFFFLLPLCVGKTISQGVAFLRSPAMVWIGSVSYGLYLWHLIVIIFIGQHLKLPTGFNGYLLLLTLTLIPSLVIGWLSSRLIEQPALRLAK